MTENRHRAYTLSWARTLADRGESATAIDQLIAEAVGYQPLSTRERHDYTGKWQRATDEDRQILRARLDNIRDQAKGAAKGVFAGYYLSHLNS